MAVISIHLTSADAPGTLGCLDPRKCPRANPSSTPWSPKNRRTKKKRLGTQISPLRGINNTTTECRDGLRQLWPETTFLEIWRFLSLETEPGTRTSRSWPGSHPRKVPNFYSEIHGVFCWTSKHDSLKNNLKKQLHIRNMIQKKNEKTIAHQKGFICKRSFCSPSHWPHVISCHKVLHSFIFKAIAYLPASLSTPCGLQPISWLSWSQWWALCLPWRNRLEDRCQRGALECATVPTCEVLH